MNTVSSFLSLLSIPHVVVAAEEIQDFIEVDGKQRPTKNSTGKLIHSTLNGIEGFWRWFGDSKVVDAEGKPLVVYHGTGDAGDFDEFRRDKIGTNHWQSGSPHLGGFFFTDKRRLAFKGAVIKDVYLRVENPYITELVDRYGNEVDYYHATDMMDNNPTQFFQRARENNNDGITISTPRGSLYVCFEPNQIKSATGNSGNFSPSSASITASYEATAVSKKDKLKAQQKAAQSAPQPAQPVKAAKQTVVSLNMAKVDGLSDRFASYATALLDALAKGTAFSDIAGQGIPVEGGGKLRTQLNRMPGNQALRSIVYAKLSDDANNRHWRFYYDVASTAVALLDIFDKDGNVIDKQQIERLVQRSRVFRSNYK